VCVPAHFEIFCSSVGLSTACKCWLSFPSLVWKHFGIEEVEGGRRRGRGLRRGRRRRRQQSRVVVKELRRRRLTESGSRE